MKRAGGVFFVLAILYSMASGPGVTLAATLTVHETEADFAAALDPAIILRSENFDGFADGTILTDQVGDVVFSSPNEGLPGFVAVQVLDLPRAVSEPNALGGGLVENGNVQQKIALDLVPPASALAFYLIAQVPIAEDVTLEFDFVDGTSSTLPFATVIGPDDDNVNFLGVTSDTAFARVTLVSNDESGGLFQNFGGIDELQFGYFDVLPPICQGQPGDSGGVLGIEGTATDDRPGDTGIASVELSPDSMNLDLLLDPLFMPGDPATSFKAIAINPGLEAQGTVLVTDGAGNSCTLCIDFKIVSEGPLLEEDLCCQDPIFFTVSNPDITPAGPMFCNSTQVDPAELPPGYELFDACIVLTIDSPISGVTEMTLEVPGDFESRLRMLFASSPDGGLTFDPFEDVTTEVAPIPTIPDPTRLKGKKGWSVVKVTCAILAEVCNGLDDDGDGLIDEGLPVGDSSVDFDEDGFALCPQVGELGDCNDQLATVNPAASEVCNGLDDDCDGVADDGDPGGGMACDVADQLGPCAAGITECNLSELSCEQQVFPETEVCDGVDNDCDGQIDDGFDVDGDGFTTCAGDCDDTDATINPA
ncbi:MAG: MopE-related protein, partial [Gemmatimonadetes bacterium]|nr:MopE-related protein [Gemmatimonadota bacterium]